MLKLNNVEKSYNSENVLKSINVEFKEGNIYIIEGDNGSGKSTLLKLITGTIYKTSGNIQRNLSIAYLPDKWQCPDLYRPSGYIESICKLYKSSVDYKRLLRVFQIPDKRINSLSKGNKQKLGIVQILSSDSDCYIFDEPTDGLDSESIEVFKKEIVELTKSDKIIIMAVHNVELFKDLNPQIIEIKDGKIAQAKKTPKKKEEKSDTPKRGRGRPRKVVEPTEQKEAEVTKPRATRKKKTEEDGE